MQKQKTFTILDPPLDDKKKTKQWAAAGGSLVVEQYQHNILYLEVLTFTYYQ